MGESGAAVGWMGGHSENGVVVLSPRITPVKSPSLKESENDEQFAREACHVA
jgi:hypothetical protein